MNDDLDTTAAVRAYLGQENQVVARAAVGAASGTSGDLEAELRAASARTGVPLTSARAMPAEVKRRAAVDETLDVVKRFPSTLAYLADENNARLSHDDVGMLTAIESAIGATARYITGANTGPTLLGDVVAGVYRASQGAAGLAAAPFGVADEGLQALDDAAAALTGTPRRQIVGTPGAESALLSLGATAGRVADRASPASGDIVQGGVSSGVQSLTQNLMALATGNPTAALASMVATQGGQSYAKGREKGVSPARSAIYGASDAAIEYATEKIPVGRLFGDLKAGTPLFATLWRQAAAEVPGEQVATLLQDLNEWAVINPEKPFSDYLKERPAAAAQTLIATLVGVGGNVAVMRAVQNATDAVTGTDRRAQALAELMQAAGESKTRERDPQGFADFVQKAAADTGAPAEVFIDVKAFSDALAQSGVTPEQITAALPSIAGQLNEAIATGGDLVVPVGELAAGIAGSPIEQALMQHVRTSPDALSQAEAKTLADEKQMRAVAEQVFAEQDAAGQENTSRDAVRKIVLDELNKAGRFTPDVNAAYADLTAQFFATQAARLGTTAEELLQRYPLKVTASTFGEALQQRQEPPVTRADLDALAAQVATQHGLKDLRLSPTATGFSVDMIAAAQPGQGAGTAAMQNLIDYADQRGLRIELTPAQKGDPNGTTSRGRLVKFYKGLGFVENKGRAKDFSTTAGMVREPKALQQSNPAAAPSKPSPETIELRKREKVLQRLLECLA